MINVRILAALMAFSALTPCGAATPMPSAGGGSSLALHADGSVRAWGTDARGELGIGTINIGYTPLAVAGIPAMQSIAAGVGHALAIATDGSVWGWGLFEHWNAPERVIGLANATAVAGGEFHNLAITADRRVWTWGANYWGQLGDGSTVTLTGRGPSPIELTDATAISAGVQHSLVLLADGTVWAFGGNDSGQLGDGTTTQRPSPVRVTGLVGIVAISAGSFNSFALAGDGTVWSWGDNRRGQLGDGTTTDRSSPVQVPGFSATRIAAGFGLGSDTYAVKADGSVWRWGENAGPVPVLAAGFSQVADIDSGGTYSVALLADGSVWTEGANDFGQGGRPGPGGLPPGPVAGLSGIAAVAAGSRFALALRNDGTVLAWGDNTYGSLGTGRLLGRATPLRVDSLQSVRKLAAGGLKLALRDDGTVAHWGSDVFGAPYVTTPQTIAGLTDIVQIASGGRHGVAIKSDGTVWTFGLNEYGQLGRGPAGNDAPQPAQVPGLAGAMRVAAGGHFTVVVLGDGTVWAFGENPGGILGVPATASCQVGDFPLQPCTPSPVQVTGIDGVAEVAAGGSHILALRSDATVWSWGNNYHGALGDGSEGGFRPEPAAVAGLSGVARVAAGGDAISVALKSDGTVWTFGDNSRGQLGTEALPFRATPGLVEGVSAIAEIAAGYDHVLALRSDGTLFGWGGNDIGQLGDGTYVDRSRPVVVLRENGDGAVDGGDWFLRLDPAATPLPIPAAATPALLAVAQLAGSPGTLNLDATAKFRGSDFGRSVNLYVLAEVPPGFFDLVKAAPGAKSAAELRAKNGEALVFAQLTPQGWTNAQGQLIAYSQNVGNAAGAAAAILGGINTASIPGARFCIGYGETSDMMLSSLTLRDVLAIAGSTASASGAPCVLSGVYLGGPASSRQGTPVTFAASVVGLSPTGSVQFFDGSAALQGSLALAPVNEAVARITVTTSSLAAGVHGISASYSGDAQNAAIAAANSLPLRHEVSAPPGGTRVDLAGPASSELGAAVAFTAIVTGDRPAGTVQFKDGAADLGAAVPLVDAMAVATVSTLALGSHAITAAYSGDAGNLASTSNAISHTVYASLATRVSLVSSRNPSAEGEPVSLTASVTGASPGGMVAFRDGATVVANASLAGGVATVTLPGLVAGLHMLAADYQGDASNPAVTSATVFQQVTAAGASLGAFAARADVATATLVTSNAITVSGAGASVPVSVAGGEYSIGCSGSFTSGPGTVADGQKLCVRHVSASAFSTTTRTTVFVGNAAADFASTTFSAAFRAGISTLVAHYYQTALRRAPDPGGRDFWESEGLRLHVLGANISEAFYAMAMAFYGSAEYAAFARDATGYLTDLYVTFFNRAPDAGGLAFWTGQLAAGMPREVLLAHFMFSKEFADFMGAVFGDRTARAEVDAVGDFYRGLLARLPDTNGFDFWVQRFRAAQCAGAASVLAEVEAISSAFANSAEYIARSRDNARHVGDLYNAFLRRGGDLGGVLFWIAQLDTGARTREDLRRTFVASPEFSARAAAIAAQGCS